MTRDENLHNAIYRAEPGLMDDIRRLLYLKKASGSKQTLAGFINEILRAYVEAHKIEVTGGGGNKDN